MKRRGDPPSTRAGGGLQVLRGTHSVREALRAGRRSLRELRLPEGTRRGEHAELEALARSRGVAVERLAPADRVGEEGARGVELVAGPLPELALEAVIGLGGEPRTLVALDGVEDPQNLGAVVRAAEAAGATALILTRRRAPPLSPAVARASAGAVEWLPVARVTNLARALGELRGCRFWSFGADPDGPDDLFALPDRVLAGNRVLVFGAEGKGLREGVRARIDHLVRIPMGGRVSSLNVSTAAAVLLFELRRRDELASVRGVAY